MNRGNDGYAFVRRKIAEELDYWPRSTEESPEVGSSKMRITGFSKAHERYWRACVRHSSRAFLIRLTR